MPKRKSTVMKRRKKHHFLREYLGDLFGSIISNENSLLRSSYEREVFVSKVPERIVKRCLCLSMELLPVYAEAEDINLEEKNSVFLDETSTKFFHALIRTIQESNDDDKKANSRQEEDSITNIARWAVNHQKMAGIK